MKESGWGWLVFVSEGPTKDLETPENCSELRETHNNGFFLGGINAYNLLKQIVCVIDFCTL